LSNNPFDSLSPTPFEASLKGKDKILLEVDILFGGLAQLGGCNETPKKKKV
jgi:hypothetical protein